jgi:hypothetical protein
MPKITQKAIIAYYINMLSWHSYLKLIFIIMLTNARQGDMLFKNEYIPIRLHPSQGKTGSLKN